MRFRTEAVGGYNLDGLIQLALLLLAVSVGGVIMLAVAACRYAAGRPFVALLIAGLVMAAPLAALAVFLLG
ncbi:hypothetical protein [Paracoccus lutimaris]|uniref:Uncharacterized protein n=1 Tax=Paracoccus lutimaris TaxID=1490030 RepID=A0A368YRC6_9RHOB|nr:hypothetical protein [Paracoccus lutimaris]RCW82138.1 hypothetical protein DFP89_11398 [Paracoccus lutimaris]